MFAVIKTGGKQYRVAADDKLIIEKAAGDVGDMIEFAEVLMVGEGAGATIGTPFVEGALVTAEVVEHGRARKVIAFKKRRRQNSKRMRGHRQHQTVIRISEILTDGKKPSKKAAAKTDTKAVTAKKADAPKKDAKPAETKAETPKAAEKAEAKAEARATLFKAPKGKGDDLTEIKGIGPVAAEQLNAEGITTFAQIAKLTDKDVAKIDEALSFSAAQIEDWREQAKALAEKK